MTNAQNYDAVFLKPGKPLSAEVDITPQSGVNYVMDRMAPCDYDLWCAIRRSLLLQVDAIERRLGISPTTSEIRRQQPR